MRAHLGHTSRKDNLYDDAHEVGLRIRAHSPGDGKTRYEFVDSKGHSVFHAMGIREAEAFVAGRGKRK